jgi:endogenous inhibitor of DNA gyrase (YacG/DUF329 family)
MKRLIKCPTCKREGDWFAGPHGPFCSRRFKLVDLGKWFDEEDSISSPLSQKDPDEAPELSAGSDESASSE